MVRQLTPKERGYLLSADWVDYHIPGPMGPMSLGLVQFVEKDGDLIVKLDMTMDYGREIAGHIMTNELAIIIEDISAERGVDTLLHIVMSEEDRRTVCTGTPYVPRTMVAGARICDECMRKTSAEAFNEE